MLWVRSKAVEVYLGETLVGCKGLDEGAERWSEVRDLDAGFATLDSWLDGADQPCRARVWLSSALARPWIIAADCGARNASELRTLASLRAGETTGLAGEVKVWTAPWRANRPTLAVAMPILAFGRLNSTRASSRRGKGWRVDSVRPWWNQVFDAVQQRSLCEGSSVAWTLVEPDGFIHARLERGETVDGAYEAPKARDPDWTLLRRRLAMGWDGVGEVDHFAFQTETAPGASSPPIAVGWATLLTVRGAAP